MASRPDLETGFGTLYIRPRSSGAAQRGTCDSPMAKVQSILLGQSYGRCRQYFLAQKGSNPTMHLTLVASDRFTKTYDFRLTASTHDHMTGRIRVPAADGRFRTALLTVGIETGREAIGLIQGQEDVVFMAVDYPFKGSWDFSGLAAIRTLGRLRSMATRTVPLLLHCLDWIFVQPFVDAEEVNVIAVSFGSFTGIPVAVIDERVKQLVVVQGGGGLSRVIAHNAKRWGATASGGLAGWLGGLFLAPFEPTRYIPHLSPRRLVMINGEGDAYFPRSSAEALYQAAGEPKEIVWHTTAHVMPEEQQLVNELVREVAVRLYGE